MSWANSMPNSLTTSISINGHDLQLNTVYDNFEDQGGLPDDSSLDYVKYKFKVRGCVSDIVLNTYDNVITYSYNFNYFGNRGYMPSVKIVYHGSSSSNVLLEYYPQDLCPSWNVSFMGEMSYCVGLLWAKQVPLYYDLSSLDHELIQKRLEEERRALERRKKELKRNIEDLYIEEKLHDRAFIVQESIDELESLEKELEDILSLPFDKLEAKRIASLLVYGGLQEDILS